MKIIYENDTEKDEFESYYKEYRGDIIVQKGEKKYKIYVTTMLRLQQDCVTEQAQNGFFRVEPNTVIVQEVTKDEIERVIKKLDGCRYFERLNHLGFAEG